jgi:transposase-like protein
MRDCWLRLHSCLPPRLVSADRSHKQRNVLNAIPRRERADVQAELVGIWQQPSKLEALTQLAAFKAKYTQRYPEAVRSLAEDEDHLLTFFSLSRSDASAHSDHQCN